VVNNKVPLEKSSTRLPENIAGLLCYALFWLTGLVFILIERKNRFVRLHAIQSVIIFGGLSIALAVGNFLGNIPDVGLIFLPLLILPAAVAWVILWIHFMVRAYQGRGIWLSRSKTAASLPCITKTAMQTKRTWVPTALGILTTVLGVVSLIWGLGFIVTGQPLLGVYPLGNSLLHLPTSGGEGALLIVFGLLAIVGGVYALQRRFWGLVLASSIGISLISYFGILSIIFAVISKKEFTQLQSKDKPILDN